MRLITLQMIFLSVCTYAFGQTFSAAYSETGTEGILIQNSFPKGVTAYTDSDGRKFTYVVFWNRIVNESATPIEVTINFPADSFPISASSYLKLFIPPDTMTYSKQILYNYGLTGLESFLDTAINKPTRLQRTIDPKEECVFYVAAVSHMPYDGAVRAEFVMQEQALFYRINVLDSGWIPCGEIAFKR